MANSTNGTSRMGGSEPLEIEFSKHSKEAMALRGLSETSVRAIVEAPAWTAPDPVRPGVTRAFGTAPETGGRWVRVAYRDVSVGVKLVITVHPDRDAEPPEGVRT